MQEIEEIEIRYVQRGARCYEIELTEIPKENVNEIDHGTVTILPKPEKEPESISNSELCGSHISLTSEFDEPSVETQQNNANKKEIVLTSFEFI